MSAARTSAADDRPSILILGVGSFAFSTARILGDAGARAATYLTRDYGHYPPSLAGPTFGREQFPSPAPLVREHGFALVIPQSIDWAQAAWRGDLLAAKAAVFCPTGAGLRIERERDFARKLCREFDIPFPKAFVASNRLEAEAILEKHPHAFVIKNPLCSPTSPIHTIMCESLADTRAWLTQVDYAEGIFLQEYLGRAEAGHIALVSGGQIHSLVTNQEYKRAFSGNMGVVAGAPLGGLVEQDPDDRYGLARELLHPLLPWFRRVRYHGPIQVTAMRRGGQWHVLEYNVRIGVTSGAMILRILADPVRALIDTGRNRELELRFKHPRRFGCSVTLAGYGYPYVQLRGPRLPVEVAGSFSCDVWWNEVELDADGRLMATGHRIADVIGFGNTLKEARSKAYANIRKIRSVGSYYRSDIGGSLWPPGSE